MDNDSSEKDNSVYNNPGVRPDIITQQPITTQPSSEPHYDEPITAPKTGNVVSDSNSNNGGEGNRRSQRVYSVDGGQNRGWTSDLFHSLTGKPQRRSFGQNARTAVHDCCCVPCMMCNLARRLGDPPYLPFIPCTGTAVRFKLRIIGGITGTIGKDCMVASCCWPCAVCQMYREMDELGI